VGDNRLFIEWHHRGWRAFGASSIDVTDPFVDVGDDTTHYRLVRSSGDGLTGFPGRLSNSPRSMPNRIC
jgi:hypothetical protein